MASEEKTRQHSTWSEKRPPFQRTVQAHLTRHRPHPCSPPRIPTQKRRWAALGGVSPPTPLPQRLHKPTPAGSRPRAPGSSARPFSGPRDSKVAVATVGSWFLFPRAQPRSPDRGGGGRSWRLGPSLEGAARPSAAGTASAASVAARSARLRPARLRSPRAVLPSLPPLPPPRGQLPRARRVFDPPSPALRISGGKEFCLGPYEHLLASLPLPSRLPHPVGARAHTHTHTLTLAGARAHARAPRAAESPADPTLSGAATHTGFQSPRGVLCLRQRRRRQQREPQLQPGRVLQLPARDGVREKRRRRTPRRGEAAPRPAPGSARRAAPAPGTAAPGKQAAAPGPAASLECPGLERGFPGPAPATAPGQRLGGEWAPGRGRGMKLEVRLVGRGA